ncbi:MAG: hypothetical protein WC867_04115 [Candidatus Pacearchaeota archaeon]|jgi:hypothetical protein
MKRGHSEVKGAIIIIIILAFALLVLGFSIRLLDKKGLASLTGYSVNIPETSEKISISLEESDIIFNPFWKSTNWNCDSYNELKKYEKIYINDKTIPPYEKGEITFTLQIFKRSSDTNYLCKHKIDGKDYSIFDYYNENIELNNEKILASTNVFEDHSATICCKEVILDTNYKELDSSKEFCINKVIPKLC